MKSRRAFLEEMKKLLVRRRDELVRETKGIASERPVTDEVMDFVDAATSLNADKVVNSIGNVEFNELEEIEDALQRIEDGTYGICEVCGREISEARLRAFPYARKCIECKVAEEEENYIDESAIE